MLSLFLKLFRPSVALTALILLGGWQGYSFMRAIPERLPFPFGTAPMEETSHEEEMEKVTEADTVVRGEEDPESLDSEPSNPVLAGISRRSGFWRAVLWVAFYTLLCFGCVPIIRRILEAESNAANAALLAGFSAVGILLAMLLSAFSFGLLSMALLLCAAAYSGGLIYLLANEVEHVQQL